ncbi:MAG: hypothetical protein PF693_17180 [Spirochaetia bacterium]|nr:hypothetical protein [Spirochaetia bacterium]
MPRGDRRGSNGMGAGRSQAHCSHMQPGPMTGRNIVYLYVKKY